MGEVEVENGSSNKPKEDSSFDEVVHEKIISQLEYYFSDNNLSRDKFMQQQTKLDEGWIPIELLLKFNRLASIVGDRDKSIIVDAIRKSTLLEVSPEADKIRRNAEHPLPEGYEELRKELMTRTIYCKGFPLENITFDDLLEFFKSHGKIDSVIMRHYIDKATKKRGFKGSAFVTFPTVEDAEAFLKLEDLKYKENPLIIKWQSVYIDDKRKERLEEKLKHQQRRRENKKPNKRKNDEDEEKEDAEDERGGFPLGASINLTGFKEGSKIHRDLIREAIESAGQSVSFIDFSIGDVTGIVRMEHAGSAAKLVEALNADSNGKLKVGDEELEVRVLEGEEETNYLDRARKELNKRRQNNRHNKRSKHRGGGRGGFGDRGRKRRGEPTDDGPPSKAAATD